MPSKTFQDLLVWQKAHQLVLHVYSFSKGFPKGELFGLTSQMRRAAVSVPANIAEGFKRSCLSDKARFYNIAQGSLEELRYYFILVEDLKYGDSAKFLKLLDEVARLLHTYSNSLRQPKSKP